MTGLLIKMFVKDKDNVENQQVRGKYAMLSSITGIIVNILLSIFKLIIGIFANSMSIISDALNNVSDAGSSIITMIGFKMSQKKVDKDHPWGHGRMEYVTAFFVDILIILVGFELLQSSIDKIIAPEMPNISNITIILLVVAILAKLWLFIFYRKIAKKIDSAAIKGTAYDSISDSISTAAVLVSALVAKFAGITIDGYVSLLVSLFILITGIKAIKETIDLLLGQKPDPEFVKSIEEFAIKYEGIEGIHDIMVHDYGPGRKIVSFHAEVPANSDICRAHDIIDQMEQDILDEFGCITTIHMDPIVVDNEEINLMKEVTTNIVKKINENYSIHDFRMTDGGERVNLIFDLVVPTDEKVDKEELIGKIQRKIKEENEKYYAVIKVEHSYV
jgi:cation diffusion facilitator family transporter